MTSDRPYRPARTLDEALDELHAGAGSQFDPVCVEAFARLDRESVEELLENCAQVQVAWQRS
jgi:HD-GYP domain-containing protein (c-di-GMP phosphodiesterase class II)